MFQLKTRLLYNKRVKGRYLHCGLQAEKIARSASPGQFLNVKVADDCQPLLRRPFSLHRVNGRQVEILYEVVGKGTEALSHKKPGEYLDVIGPLGNGFSCPESASSRSLSILAAGGMGVAPLVFLAQRLSKANTRKRKHKILVLIGARSKGEVLCENDFKKLGCSVKIATDDASRGLKGKVTELLKKILASGTANGRQAAIYACGPRPMLRQVCRISSGYKIPAQMSLEEHMACGIGACLGCAVNTARGYQRVCKEGPVFEAGEIIW